MSARKWPFYTMAVGEEAVIPLSPRSSAYRLLTVWKERTGWVFVTRRCGDVRLVKRLA